MSKYNTKVISKTILLRPDNSVLLIKRSLSDDRGPGEWDLPGGTADPGENYLSAACRETREEVGILIDPSEAELVYASAGKYKHGNRCWLFFLAVVTQTQNVTLSEEHTEKQWLPIKQAMAGALFQKQELALRYVAEHVLGDRLYIGSVSG